METTKRIVFGGHLESALSDDLAADKVLGKKD